MSFVNLMGNDIWSDTDITTRTEAMIRSEFSLDAENILNRKVTGMALGVYQLTGDEQAELGRYQVVCEQAKAAGIAARADILLLTAVLAVESGAALLADAASDVADLYHLRNPVVEEIEP